MSCVVRGSTRSGRARQPAARRAPHPRSPAIPSPRDSTRRRRGWGARARDRRASAPHPAPRTRTVACSSDSRSTSRSRSGRGVSRSAKTTPKPGQLAKAPRLIVRERLAAAVQDDPIGGRPADDAGEDGQGAVVPGGRAERHLRAVEIDVVARPQLGDAVLLQAEARRRRCADADFLDCAPRAARPLPPAA